MSNTLNLGTDGNWGVKKDSLLGYNSENNNFKPLAFDFTRASSATVVNKAGLIETVGSGEPRIDFLGNTKGALKLEPQRTNVIPYSEDFSNAAWILADVTRTLNYGITPEGLTNSVLITEGSGSAQHRAYSSSSSSSSIHTLSAFVKNSNGSRQAYIDMGPVTGFFNFDTETMYSALGTTSVEKWANGWYRISITSTSAFTAVATYLGLGNSNTETFQGNGTSSIEFFAPQLEQGSYATSYIPTSGSAVTRLEEDIALTLPDNASFNSSVGFTLCGEFSTNGGSGSSSMALQVNGNLGYFGFGSNGSTWRARINNGTVNSAHISNIPILSTVKLALSFNSSGFSMYANGTSFASGNTNIGAITSADSILYRDTDEFGSFRIKDLKLYNTRLSDSELATLTTI